MRRALLALALLAAPAGAQVVANLPVTCNAAGSNCTVAQPVTRPDGLALLPVQVTSTQTGGSITVGGTYQSVLAANSTRRGCAIHNTSTEVERIYLGAPGGATAANTIPIPAGGSFNCGSFQGIVATDQISMTSLTSGSTFVVVSQ